MNFSTIFWQNSLVNTNRKRKKVDKSINESMRLHHLVKWNKGKKTNMLPQSVQIIFKWLKKKMLRNIFLKGKSNSLVIPKVWFRSKEFERLRSTCWKIKALTACVCVRVYPCVCVCVCQGVVLVQPLLHAHVKYGLVWVPHHMLDPRDGAQQQISTRRQSLEAKDVS